MSQAVDVQKRKLVDAAVKLLSEGGDEAEALSRFAVALFREGAAEDVVTYAPTELAAIARDAYERIVRDKLDVIKTALAMGYSRADIEALDARLEKLIGRDKLDELLSDEGAPLVDADLMDTDLTHELNRLRDTLAD